MKLRALSDGEDPISHDFVERKMEELRKTERVRKKRGLK